MIKVEVFNMFDFFQNEVGNFRQIERRGTLDEWEQCV
jgi:hypothetical protein